MTAKVFWPLEMPRTKLILLPLQSILRPKVQGQCFSQGRYGTHCSCDSPVAIYWHGMRLNLFWACENEGLGIFKCASRELEQTPANLAGGCLCLPRQYCHICSWGSCDCTGVWKRDGVDWSTGDTKISRQHHRRKRVELTSVLERTGHGRDTSKQRLKKVLNYFISLMSFAIHFSSTLSAKEALCQMTFNIKPALSK